MKRPVRGLYAIVDNVEMAQSCLEGGVKILQVRIKRPATPGDITQAIRQVRELKKNYDFSLIVNDHLDLAKEMGADGYHGGVEDPAIEQAREILGPDKMVGYSTHSLGEALAAERRGADYIGFGAIYPTTAKGPEHPIVGVEKLRQVVRSVKIPVVAIGGINRDNIQEVLSTGVASVAMISAILKSGNIVDETKFYCGLFS